MKGISFLEQKRNEPERLKFMEYIKSKGVNYFHEIEDLIKSSCEIIFVHEGDFVHLNIKDERANSKLRERFSNSIIIIFGGKPTSFELTNSKIISYINYSDLSKKFDEIFKYLNETEYVNIKKLKNIIFNRSSTLEKLLEPFQKFSPFANPAENEDLKNAFQDINAYIKDNNNGD